MCHGQLPDNILNRLLILFCAHSFNFGSVLNAGYAGDDGWSSNHVHLQTRRYPLEASARGLWGPIPAMQPCLATDCPVVRFRVMAEATVVPMYHTTRL
eukprot:COSAG04_NODE_1027_length_8681_cov_106.498019_4_plen_98_part_00